MLSYVTRSQPGCVRGPCAPPSLHNLPSEAHGWSSPSARELQAGVRLHRPRQAPTPSQCPRRAGRARADPPEWGPVRTPLSPGAPTPGPGEAPCGSCHPHDPCVTPWPQLSHHRRNKPSGAVRLALSQADTISWPQTVPSTSGDGTAGTSPSQHQQQLWISWARCLL